MIKRLFWVAVGMAGALQLDRFLERKRAKLSASGLTGTLLDKVNARLEERRPGAPVR